jgi:hypothetical protein
MPMKSLVFWTRKAKFLIGPTCRIGVTLRARQSIRSRGRRRHVPAQVHCIRWTPVAGNA